MHKNHRFYSNDISLLEVHIMTSKILLWQAKYLKSLKRLFLKCNVMPCNQPYDVFSPKLQLWMYAHLRTFNSATVVPWAFAISALQSTFPLRRVKLGVQSSWERPLRSRVGLVLALKGPGGSTHLNLWRNDKSCSSLSCWNPLATHCSSINKLCALGSWSFYVNRAEIRPFIFCSFLHLLSPSYPSALHKASSVARGSGASRNQEISHVLSI